jgi:hypothetical protein
VWVAAPLGGTGVARGEPTLRLDQHLERRPFIHGAYPLAPFARGTADRLIVGGPVADGSEYDVGQAKTINSL